MSRLHHLLLVVSCLILQNLAPSPALSEFVTKCSKKTYATSSNWASGQHCSFNALRGEELFVYIFYKGPSGVFPFSVTGSVNNGGLPLMEARLNNNQRVSLSRYITNAQVGNSVANWTLPSRSSIDYEILSDRTNLRVSDPSINSSTGTLTLPHSVTTATPFTPGSTWVPLRLFSYSSSMPNSTQLTEKGLKNCVDRALCSDTISIPFSERLPIPRGHTSLALTINHPQAYAETISSDNIREVILDDFFIEKVPAVMGNYSSRWSIAKENLNYWMDRGVAIKNASVGDGIDWNLGFRKSVDTSWFLDPKNATDLRIINKYNELKQPSFFDTTGTRNLLAERVRKKFKENPSATQIALSISYSTSFKAKDYHPQHIRFNQAQSGGITSGSRLDAVTAAFGGFSFYLVPFGTAKKEGSKYRITITSVKIHVVDSFDFNGTQPLGCFKEPNIVIPPLGSGQCFHNATFRWYRFMKARGSDYNLFALPKTETLSTPVTYLISQ